MSMKKRRRQFLAWLLCVVMLASTGAADLIPVWATELSGKLEDLATGSNAETKDEEEDDLSATASNATPADAEVETDIFDLALPSQATYKYRYVTEDGVTVIVEALDCIFDEGTTVKVKTLTTADMTAVTSLVKEALPEGQSDVSAVYAYDISFWCDDEEFEPDGEVKVTFQFPEDAEAAAKPEQMEIFHVADEMKAADIMPKVAESQTEVACMADGFSVYGVARVAEEECIEIWNVEDLKSIYDERDTYGKTYKLMSDIDLEGIKWNPIGNEVVTVGIMYTTRPFNGTFDGNGYTIKNMSIDNPQVPHVGLFAEVRGTLKNVVLDNINIQISNNDWTGGVVYGVGGLAGDAYNSNIINCKVTGKITNVTGSKTVAGIIGKVSRGNTIIDGCVSDVNISVDETENICAAGIAVIDGFRQDAPVINNCTNLGNIISDVAGGIAVERSGETNLTITSCMNKGKITGLNSSAGIFSRQISSGNSIIEKCANEGEIISKSGKAGGICASSSGTISQCFNKGEIISRSGIAGGICAKSGSTISQCFNAGSVRGKQSVGGIVGECHMGNDWGIKIEDCFNCGSILESDHEGYNSCGGIIGTLTTGNGEYKDAKNCYNVGTIDNLSSMPGPVVGSRTRTVFINSYYLDNIREVGYTPSGASKCTSEELQKKETYKEWDFDSIWKMGSGDYPYPVFQWQTDDLIEPDEKDSLHLVSVSPENWETQVKPTAIITLTFNKVINFNMGIDPDDSVLEIRDYYTDEVVYSLPLRVASWYIRGKQLVIGEALTNCRAARCYVYIPNNAIYTIEEKADGSHVEEYFEGIERKEDYSFVMEHGDTVHTVTFAINDKLSITESVPDGNPVLRPADPDKSNAPKEGYVFSKWHLKNETKEYDFNTLIYEDITLYASWKMEKDTVLSSDDNDDNSSDEKTTTSINQYYSDGWEKNENGNWVCRDENGNILTGYQEGLYWNGLKGNWYFDENGAMLTGWHNGKYFNETGNGYKGIEITSQNVINYMQGSDAAATIGQYSYAVIFVDDIDKLTKMGQSLKNWSDALKATIIGVWNNSTGQGSNDVLQDIADAYMQDPVNNKAFLADIINEMFSTETWRDKYSSEGGDALGLTEQGLNVGSQVSGALLSQVESASDEYLNSIVSGYKKSNLEVWKALDEKYDLIDIDQTILSTVKTVSSFSQEYQKCITDYTQNIAYLESLKKSTYAGSVMDKAIDDLIEDYKQQSANSGINMLTDIMKTTNDWSELITGLELVDSGVMDIYELATSDDVEMDLMKKMLDGMKVTNFGKADAIIQIAMKDAAQVSAVDKVIYSTYLRSDAIMALRNAENKLKADTTNEEALREYMDAFDCAKAITITQYKNMQKYYSDPFYNKSDKYEKIDYLGGEIAKLESISFLNYANGSATAYYDRVR